MVQEDNRADSTTAKSVRDVVHFAGKTAGDTITNAADNPEMYELMFGRTIWQNQAATNDLKEVAFPCFQFQVTMLKVFCKI